MGGASVTSEVEMGLLSTARGLMQVLLVTTGLSAAVCRARAVIEILPDAPSPQHFQEDFREMGANEQMTRSSVLWAVTSRQSVLDPMQNLANRSLLGSAVPRPRTLPVEQRRTVSAVPPPDIFQRRKLRRPGIRCRLRPGAWRRIRLEWRYGRIRKAAGITLRTICHPEHLEIGRRCRVWIRTAV